MRRTRRFTAQRAAISTEGAIASGEGVAQELEVDETPKPRRTQPAKKAPPGSTFDMIVAALLFVVPVMALIAVVIYFAITNHH
jgi:hypothetical protein